MLTDEEKKNAKPLILNTQMVKAILDGRKKRFSKVVEKPIDFEVESTNVINAKDGGISEVELINFDTEETLFVKPQYKVGDVFYVKETFAENFGVKKRVIYKADFNDDAPFSIKWKPSTHMPKKYARIFLKITDSRFENLQDISVDSSVREGYCNKNIVNEFDYNDHLSRFHNKQWANFVGQDNKKATYHDEVHKLFYAKNKALKQEIYSWWINILNSTTKEDYKVEDEPLIFGFDFKRIDNEKE